MNKAKEKKGRIIFRRIRYKKGRVELDFTEKFDDYFNELTMDMAQEPMDSFKEALQALSPDVIEICELPDPKKALKDRIEIHTINIKYETEKEIPGCVISFKIKRENRSGSVSINTPYQLLEARDANEAQVLSSETAERIYNLMSEAERYRLGDRKQFQLQFEETETKETENPISPELNFVEGSGKYVVKVERELIGIIKPGTLIQLTQLANTEKFLKEDPARKGVFFLNPGKKIKSENGFKRNVYTLIRNDDILILDEIMENNISAYGLDSVNQIVIDTNMKYFGKFLSASAAKSA